MSNFVPKLSLWPKLANMITFLMMKIWAKIISKQWAVQNFALQCWTLKNPDLNHQTKSELPFKNIAYWDEDAKFKEFNKGRLYKSWDISLMNLFDMELDIFLSHEFSSCDSLLHIGSQCSAKLLLFAKIPCQVWSLVGKSPDLFTNSLTVTSWVAGAGAACARFF